MSVEPSKLRPLTEAQIGNHLQNSYAKKTGCNPCGCMETPSFFLSRTYNDRASGISTPFGADAFSKGLFSCNDICVNNLCWCDNTTPGESNSSVRKTARCAAACLLCCTPVGAATCPIGVLIGVKTGIQLERLEEELNPSWPHREQMTNESQDVLFTETANNEVAVPYSRLNEAASIDQEKEGCSSCLAAVVEGLCAAAGSC